MNALSLSVALAAVIGLLSAAPAFASDPSAGGASPAPADATRPRLIIRIDDVGFCHAANLAAQRILAEGGCTSVSVIVNTPWLDEAAAILAAHPEVAVGVHLTLNSEWREYRWGPVLPYSQVPSLVDEFGKFFPSRDAFFAHHPKAGEVEAELQAQIELALHKGLNISYVDYHMGTAMSTREFQQIVERLAEKFHLGISQYFGETYAPSVYRAAPAEKLAEGLRILDSLDEPKLYLFVVHPGLQTPEMAVLTDLNTSGLPQMAAHRQAETDMLCSPEFKARISQRGIQLTGYQHLRALGLDNMRRPWLAEPYPGQSAPRP